VAGKTSQEPFKYAPYSPYLTAIRVIESVVAPFVVATGVLLRWRPAGILCTRAVAQNLPAGRWSYQTRALAASSPRHEEEGLLRAAFRV